MNSCLEQSSASKLQFREESFMPHIETISVAEAFSRHPGPRNKEDGKDSGEEFREKYLEPPLRDPNTRIIVDLDGVVGYIGSFLEEAFGGLVRTFGADICDRVEIIAVRRPTWRNEALQYMREAVEDET